MLCVKVSIKMSLWKGGRKEDNTSVCVLTDGEPLKVQTTISKSSLINALHATLLILTSPKWIQYKEPEQKETVGYETEKTHTLLRKSKIRQTETKMTRCLIGGFVSFCSFSVSPWSHFSSLCSSNKKRGPGPGASNTLGSATEILACILKVT